MQKLALIGLGGVAGTMMRYWVSQWIEARTSPSFPYGTLAVNLTGCLAAGFLFQLLEQTGASAGVKLAIMVGLLGAFTTFSTFGVQTLLLARNEGAGVALLNVLVSNVAGIFMIWIGIEIARRAV